MKTLHLNLHKHWFVMTLEKIKTEDYRELTPYWFRMLVFDYKTVFKYFTGINWKDATEQQKTDGVYHICRNKIKHIGFKPFDTTTLSNGYSKERPQFITEHKGIKIDYGKTEWGAEYGKRYFVIKHGDLVSQSNCG